MNCPNCGATANSLPGERFTKCVYCGSSIAIFELRDGHSSSEKEKLSKEERDSISKLFELASIDLDNQNYQSALKIYDKIIERKPSFWEAYTNKAVCIFWLGREDFSHMKQVRALLDKADTISGTRDEIGTTREEIAYNIVAIGAKKERYGDILFEALNCFRISKELILQHDDRDKIIDNFVESAYQEVENRLIRLLNRDKKEFDPPKSEIKVLNELIIAHSNPPKSLLASFIRMIKVKKTKHKDFNKLDDHYELVKKDFAEIFNNEKPPDIKFSFFGKPSII